MNDETLNPYRRDVDDVLSVLGSGREGLSDEEAERRLAHYGPNRLEEKKKHSLFWMFLGQFSDFMIVVLLGAAVISGFLGEVVDALAIIFIVLLNAILGFFQEYRAEKAMQALKAMASQEAGVLRAGKQSRIPAEEIVPGDIIILEAGNVVPADLRLIETFQLKTNESSLTGESVPLEKSTKTLHEKHLPLGDRKNMAFSGTAVTLGRGRGIAVATGMETELGKIASLLQEQEEEKTPLQKRMADLGKKLSLAFLAICALVFAIGLIRGGDPIVLFITAVSLAVAAIPEALPAIITISLSIGAKKMVEEKALIRRLPAVETLGSITYICSDKTGTLTQNRMDVEEIYWKGKRLKPFSLGLAAERPDLLLRIATLSNDASEDEGKFKGDPTEIALLRMGSALGFRKSELEKTSPRLNEIPFDTERKCMTTFHSWEEKGILSITKGAPEAVISRASRILGESGADAVDSRHLHTIIDSMAADGLRILAFAVREWETMPESVEPETVERDLTFVGLVGMLDPPRQEVFDAVKICKRAGIRPVMITGDHPITAKVIAQRLEIVEKDHSILTGSKLDALSLEELEERVREIQVYARVAPEQKLKIVRALQEKGEYVAMTGDGVNDAPALKKADIGVAMGITGTDVAKEASDMILLDDNFATIVKAVREGRRIFDNILKFVKYILSSNVGEIATIFLAPFFGFPVPLVPIQILWINLVTDGLPGIAFSSESAEADVMARPPRDPKEGVFAHGIGTSIMWGGLVLGGITLISQGVALKMGWHWQTITFNVLCISQLWNAFACRSFSHSVFELGLTSNRFLFWTVLGTALLQIGTIYLPFFNHVLRTQPLSVLELVFMLAMSLCLFAAVETAKLLKRSFGKKA